MSDNRLINSIEFLKMKIYNRSIKIEKKNIDLYEKLWTKGINSCVLQVSDNLIMNDHWALSMFSYLKIRKKEK